MKSHDISGYKMPNLFRLSKTLTRIIFLTLLLGLIIVGIFFFILPPMEHSVNSNQEVNKPGSVSPLLVNEAPLPVEATPARYGDLVMHITATGLTRPLREVIIVSKVGGEIVALPISEGQQVKKGQLLMKLDDREYRLSLAEARDALLDAQVEYGLMKAEPPSYDNTSHTSSSRFNLNLARQEWEQAKKKYQCGEITESEYEQARMDYETALIFTGQRREELMANKSGLSKALIALKRAELNLSYTEILAPFPGIIADLNIQLNQWVSPGQECFKLMDLSQIEVEAAVLESEMGLVKKGRKAEVNFAAYPGEIFNGQVVSINPLIDPETKTCRVRVRLDNPLGKLKAGMFAYVKLESQIFKNRFIVPKEAVLVRDNRKLVFIVRSGPDGKSLAKWCYVDTGLENEQYVEITSSTMGLKEGELVITSGHYTLTHDAPVKVMNRK